MAMTLRWALICSVVTSFGCGYLDEEIQLTDEAFAESFGEGFVAIGGSHGWSGGCGGMYGTSGGYGYGASSQYFGFGALGIVGVAANPGAAPLASPPTGVGVDQEELFEQDVAPTGAIEAVMAATVEGREAVVVQFAQARGPAR